jgi:hypothetical protein
LPFLFKSPRLPEQLSRKRNKNSNLKVKNKSQAWWNTSIIPVFQKVRQKDHEVKASLGYIARPCFKAESKTKKEIKLSPHYKVT